MIDVFTKLCVIGSCVGTVTSATMYDSGLMTVDGVNKEGKPFHITMSIKEEEENA